METWKLAQGFGATFVVSPPRDVDGSPVTGLAGTEPLAGEVWAGDDQDVLIPLSPAWPSSPDGSTINVPIAAVASAVLAPGTYAVQVYLADKSKVLHRGRLEILASAGTADAPFSYITYDQMLAFSPEVGRLQDDSDEAGFAEQRAQASAEFDRWVLNRYHPLPGRSRREAPYLQWSLGPLGEDAPSRDDVAALLGTEAVIVNADLAECIAHLTLSIIYLGTPGRDNTYRETGQSERQAALMCFKAVQVELDLDDDQVADVRVSQDVVWLN